MKGVISKKTTLHLQHTFLVHFFAIALHDYNLKLPSLYTFYWGNIICIPVRFFCSVGMWGHTNFVRKYQAGAACLAKPILRKKNRLFCSLSSWKRRLSSQAKKSLSKLNAETSLWTGLWSSGELGGVHFHFCAAFQNLPRIQMSLSRWKFSRQGRREGENVSLLSSSYG